MEFLDNNQVGRGGSFIVSGEFTEIGGVRAVVGIVARTSVQRRCWRCRRCTKSRRRERWSKRIPCNALRFAGAASLGWYEEEGNRMLSQGQDSPSSGYSSNNAVFQGAPCGQCRDLCPAGYVPHFWR
ncbi:hypothetical protein KPH14_001360 [Odynerus spinipes]|uniref:Uncharacterized protein n=1 Tax=Odynerus spinipes TaxID=1348599 RepID=A0AAD9VKT9_9HYME|nr:hypothetical protein KPH14_001360 [Odynerus spinipes]